MVWHTAPNLRGTLDVRLEKEKVNDRTHDIGFDLLQLREWVQADRQSRLQDVLQAAQTLASRFNRAWAGKVLDGQKAWHIQ
jgi:proline dehydrogenase